MMTFEFVFLQATQDNMISVTRAMWFGLLQTLTGFLMGWALNELASKNHQAKQIGSGE
jgi:hypothetical protein